MPSWAWRRGLSRGLGILNYDMRMRRETGGHSGTVALSGSAVQSPQRWVQGNLEGKAWQGTAERRANLPPSS